VTYVLSRTVSELSQRIRKIIVFDRDSRYLTASCIYGVKPVNYGLRNFDTNKIRNITIVWRTTYFDILNRLGLNHQCNRQTDGQNYSSDNVRL